MAADGARPDELALLWKALYALAGICGAGFLFLFAFIQRGKAALWASVNQQGRDAGDTREAAALRYATKHDLEQLGERLDGSIQQSERRIMAAIRDRGPVRSFDKGSEPGGDER